MGEAQVCWVDFHGHSAVLRRRRERADLRNPVSGHASRLFRGTDQVATNPWYDQHNHAGWRAGGPKSKLKDSLLPLNLEYVDIYLVHGPIHPSTISTVAKGMADCVESGMARAVGVANFDTKEMIKMADELAKHDVPLSVCQCEYSIVRRLSEVSGMIRECKKRSICFQGFTSLAEGRFSNKYSRFNEPQRKRRFSSYPMNMLEPTINILKRIAEERRVSVPAVALNYSINKSVLPLVSVRDTSQAEQDMQALGWRLTKNEMKRIEGVSLQGSRSSFMQHG